MAILADLGVDAGVHLILIHGQIGAVCLAVAAQDAAGGAILCLFLGSILGGAGNHLDSLVGHDSDKVLGAGICTIAAAHALIGVNLGNAFDDGNSIIAADSNALAMAKAAGGTHTVVAKVQLCSLLAGLDTHIVKNHSASAVAAAADESDRALELGKVMQLVNNDLLAALYGAGNTANALFIVDNSMVVNDGNRALGTGSLTLAAGDAAIAAGLSHEFIVFLSGGAGYKVGGISRNHADKALGADAFLGAVTTPIALLPVNNYLAVDELHGTFGAACYAGTYANASILALASHKAHFNGFSAGLALCEACLSGSASGAGNKGNLFFLHLSTIRSH